MKMPISFVRDIFNDIIIFDVNYVLIFFSQEMDI